MQAGNRTRISRITVWYADLCNTSTIWSLSLSSRAQFEMIQARCQNPLTVSSNSELNFPPKRKIVGWAGIEPALYGVTIRCHTLWLPTHFAKQNPSSLTLSLTLTIVASVWECVWDWSSCAAQQRAGDSNSQFPHQELPVFKTGPSSSRTPAIWRSQIPSSHPLTHTEAIYGIFQCENERESEETAAPWRKVRVSNPRAGFHRRPD